VTVTAAKKTALKRLDSRKNEKRIEPGLLGKNIPKTSGTAKQKAEWGKKTDAEDTPGGAESGLCAGRENLVWPGGCQQGRQEVG